MQRFFQINFQLAILSEQQSTRLLLESVCVTDRNGNTCHVEELKSSLPHNQKDDTSEGGDTKKYELHAQSGSKTFQVIKKNLWDKNLFLFPSMALSPMNTKKT